MLLEVPLSGGIFINPDPDNIDGVAPDPEGNAVIIFRSGGQMGIAGQAPADVAAWLNSSAVRDVLMNRAATEASEWATAVAMADLGNAVDSAAHREAMEATEVAVAERSAASARMTAGLREAGRTP